MGLVSKSVFFFCWICWIWKWSFTILIIGVV